MEPDRFVIDSNTFVAVYHEGDVNHRKALDILSELNNMNAGLVTFDRQMLSIFKS